MDRKTRPGKTKATPRLTVKCGNCGHPVGNPLTHRCVAGTDFRHRRRAAEKAAKRKPAPAGNAHEYTACDDDDCSRFQCRVYKEGVADGIAACPLPHQG